MSGVGYQCLASASSSFSKSSTSTPDATEIDAKLFREFVFGHIRTALSDGFNDNIGRTNVAPVFELPTCDVWYKLYDALVDFFLTDTPKSSKIAAYYSQLKSQIDLDVQFSENRCKKLIPSALGLYQENLPAYYNKHQHQQRVIIGLVEFFVCFNSEIMIEAGQSIGVVPHECSRAHVQSLSRPIKT